MKLSFGAFKQLYMGYGIYFNNGTFNVEGGERTYKTRAEAKKAIEEYRDKMQAMRDDPTGKLVGNIENLTITAPNGYVHGFISKADMRAAVFGLIEKYDADIVWE